MVYWAHKRPGSSMLLASILKGHIWVTIIKQKSSAFFFFKIAIPIHLGGITLPLIKHILQQFLYKLKTFEHIQLYINTENSKFVLSPHTNTVATWMASNNTLIMCQNTYNCDFTSLNYLPSTMSQICQHMLDQTRKVIKSIKQLYFWMKMKLWEVATLKSNDNNN